jgi:hypothetical protein
MPFLPSLSRKHSGGSILKHSSEFFGGYVLLRYGYIRRGAVHHQVRQKCLQIRQRLFWLVVPDRLSRHAHQFSRIGKCESKLVKLVPNPKNHRRHSNARIAGCRWQYHGLGFRLPLLDSKGTSSPGMAGNRPPKTDLETATAIVLDYLNAIEKRANLGQLSRSYARLFAGSGASLPYTGMQEQRLVSCLA